MYRTRWRISSNSLAGDAGEFDDILPLRVKAASLTPLGSPCASDKLSPAVRDDVAAPVRPIVVQGWRDIVISDRRRMTIHCLFAQRRGIPKICSALTPSGDKHHNHARALCVNRKVSQIESPIISKRYTVPDPTVGRLSNRVRLSFKEPGEVKTM
jgi:hypothetical protein